MSGGIDPGAGLDELGREMWGVHHALARTPRPAAGSVEDRLELIEIELAAKDVLTRYAYFYDGKDLDGLMSVFHPESRVVNPRGTYEGIEAIRENYSYLMGVLRIVFHYAPNVMVRIAADRRSAWVTSYLFSVGVVEESRFNGNCSSYVARVVVDDGEWRIREMRITTNVPIELRRREDAMRAFGSPPKPTVDVSSGDWIGTDFVA